MIKNVVFDMENVEAARQVGFHGVVFEGDYGVVKDALEKIREQAEIQEEIL